MIDRQEAVVNMYQAVDMFFAEEKEKLVTDKILKNHADQLHIIVTDIAKYMQV